MPQKVLESVPAVRVDVDVLHRCLERGLEHIALVLEQEHHRRPHQRRKNRERLCWLRNHILLHRQLGQSHHNTREQVQHNLIWLNDGEKERLLVFVYGVIVVVVGKKWCSLYGYPPGCSIARQRGNKESSVFLIQVSLAVHRIH